MEKKLKLKEFFTNIFKKIKNTAKDGKKWIGIDGLINMETSALLTIFLMIFFPPMYSVLFSLIIVLAKTTLDKSRGHIQEYHDFICACVGVLGGMILGLAVPLF